jgi:hypothetical protein
VGRAERGQRVGGRCAERGRRQAGVPDLDGVGESRGQGRTGDLLDRCQEPAGDVVGHGAHDVGPEHVADEDAGETVFHVLAH